MTTVAPVSWPADPPPRLVDGEVAVFAVRLDVEAGPQPLAPDERERADRFATPELRRRWARARGALRQVLGAYAEADPAGVRLEPAACVHCGEPHGKPFLAEPTVGWLRFSVSHSGELALLAVAHGREVGVDVEAARARRRMQGIADRSFTADEAAAIRSAATEAERDATFYRLWARKEAYLKATAEGLAGSLAAFDALQLRPPAGDTGWEFADVDAGPGYAAALAVAPPGYSPGG